MLWLFFPGVEELEMDDTTVVFPWCSGTSDG